MTIYRYGEHVPHSQGALRRRRHDGDRPRDTGASPQTAANAHQAIEVGERSNLREGPMLHNGPDHALVVGAGVTVGPSDQAARLYGRPRLFLLAAVLEGAVIGAETGQRQNLSTTRETTRGESVTY